MNLKVKHVLFCKDKKKVKEIYFSAFPKKERMPFGFMLVLSCLPTTKFLAYYDEGTVCGFLYYGKVGRQVFVMFFAVDEQLRSSGYGSEILSMLHKKYPKCQITVSIDPPIEGTSDSEIRQRRKQFYQRNGFIDSEYDIKLNGMMQQVLVSGGAFSKTRFSAFLLAYSCLAIIPRLRRRIV